MKRRRSSAPGRFRPDGRWAKPILLAALFTMVLAACGQATSTDAPPVSPPSDQSSTEPSLDAPTDAPTEGPTASGEPTTPEPTAPATPGSSPGAPSGTGSVAACSGSDENRDFFASMAAAVDWTVYCPSLSDGWFVDDGQYRLANGGWMEISYDGPGDARIVLRQGSFCESADGCVPVGTELGDAVFGDRTGTLVAAADGSWVVVVDRGAVPSWVLVVAGLDEATARTIAGDLITIAG